MANVIEEAKSGRASCRTCKKAIAKGELRFGEEAPNAFGDTPSIRWHHLLCAAEKLPAELKAVLDTYPDPVPNRAELDKAMSDALSKGRAKPGGFPYADKAPTQGIGDSKMGTFGKIGAAIVLRKAFADKEKMENMLADTDLDWIVVRPGLLTNGKPRGTWRAADDGSIVGGMISRADTATFMLQQIESTEWLRRRPVVVW